MSSEDDEENSKDKAAADWISRIYGGAAVVLVFGVSFKMLMEFSKDLVMYWLWRLAQFCLLGFLSWCL